MTDSKLNNIREKIHKIRGVQVMLDIDLALMYKVEIKYLNKAVKRNIDRFPEKFCFQLNDEEYGSLWFQIGTLNQIKISKQESTINESRRGKHRKYLPYVFTEQGVSMLSAVLRSKTAINVSIQIMDAFVEMRRFIARNALLFQKIDILEKKQIKTDQRIDKVFEALQEKTILSKQGIFYEGQIFDAYKLVSDIIRVAKKSIIIIDNYMDDTLLNILSKRNKGVSVILFTRKIASSLKQDISKFNKQYDYIEARELNTSHDRFLIIDESLVYHFGASLKDIGKKWFAFSKLEIDAVDILRRLDL